MKVKQILCVLKKSAPFLCALIAGGGVIFSSVVSSKAGERATKAEMEAIFNKGSDLTSKEAFFVKAPHYIVPIVSTCVTVAFVFGCHVLNKKAQASIVAGAVALEESFRKYKLAAIQKYGEEFDKVVKAQLMENALAEAEAPKDGMELFYDEITNTVFESTREEVLQGIINCHTCYARCGSLGLNEYREFLGMKADPQYENIGWDMGTVVEWLGDYCVDIELSPDVINSKPCSRICVCMEPIVNYQDWDYCDTWGNTVFFPSGLTDQDILGSAYKQSNEITQQTDEQTGSPKIQSA